MLFAVAGGIWARPEDTPWHEDPFSYFGLACVLLGLPVLLARAIAGIVYQRTINMFCTMVIAVGGALALLDLWEAAAIVFFFVLSEWLQRWCVHHTTEKTKGLGGMLPDTVSPADGSADKPLAEVLVGEAVLVKPGQAVPTDGVVLDGRSAVDESMLTGESMPVQKAQGASVFAGTTNQGGVLTVRVMRLPSESAAAQLTIMVATPQRAGSKELFLERFAKVYTLAILVTALLLATVPLGTCTWSTVGSHGSDGVNRTTAAEEAAASGPGMCVWWLRRALALVVISCPCSLIVAMPVTYACGVSALAKWGVLVKSQAQMELLARLHTLALDKTGTLTEGRFRLRQVAPVEAVTRQGDAGLRRIVGLVAAAEKNSSHPIAEAFLEYAETMGVDPPPAKEFELLEGEGIRAKIDGTTVHVGSEKLAKRLLARAEAARRTDARVLEARRALRAASRALDDANRDELPRRVVEALRRREAAALDALEEADAAARGNTQQMLPSAASDETTTTDGVVVLPQMLPPHLVTCRDHERCGGCAPKVCSRHGGAHSCTGSCCHRHCCGNPCEHTGPCPSTEEEDNSTGASHDSCYDHNHSHGGGEGCTHDHSHGGGEGCTHNHSHGGGEGCTHNHSHGGGEGCTHDHSHGGGEGCTHDQSHAGGGGQQQHEHSHDGVPCSGDHAYEGYDLTLSSPIVNEWSSGGASVVWVFVDGKIAAAVEVAEVRAACQLSDQIRAETAPAMSALASLGVGTTMLTGDAEGTAQAVRVQAGIVSVCSSMKPHEKLERVRALAKDGVVGMVGDGVNDGPALAAADVGIAMGVGGTALASQAAGVILMTNDLRRLADAVVGARLTTRMLRRSVAVALFLKLLPLVLIFTLPGSAEGVLVAAAVGSDLFGIALVLLGAISLLGARPRFATTPCGNSQNSMEGPAVVTSLVP